MLLRLLLCLLLSVGSLSAQVLNVESQRFNSDSMGWIGRVGFATQVQQSVQRVFGLDAELHVQYRKGKSRFLFLGDQNLVQAGGTDFINTGYEHIRYNYRLRERLTWEAFVQTQYNKPMRMDFRGVTGTGPRFRLLKREKIHMYVASLYMFEHEEVTGEPTVYDDHRSSSYFTFTWIISPQADVSGTVFYQPNLRNFSDYRIATDMALDLDVTKRIAFRATFNLLYDDKQPAGVPNLTYQQQNSLELKF